jgi:hypothetical protein
MTMSAPPAGRGQPVAEPPRWAEAGDCPRCGAAYDAYQEYCLECGLRLPGARGMTSALAGARAGVPTQWAWPVLVTLVVALLATVVVAAVQVAADDEAEPLLVATTEQSIVPTITEIVPTETVPLTPPTVTEAPPPVSPPPAPPPAGARLITWPAGVDGYTVVLNSLPAPGGRAEATQKARAAADAGLAEVGVLDSSRYSSLHPGYYVVFSGVYGSMAEATRFVDEARRRGFDTAYARLIAS